MKNLLTFEEFILENKILVVENSLLESVFGSKRVAIMPGRYQPTHLGHIAAFRELSRRFQVPVVPIQILSKTEKSPFSDNLLKKMGESIVKEYDFIADFILYPQNLKTVIPLMVKLLREEYDFEPIGMGCGSDRLKAYEPQIRYINSDRSDVPISEPFRLEMVDERVPGGPSGTKVRDSIRTGDRELFEQMTPKSLHRFFDELEKQMK